MIESEYLKDNIENIKRLMALQPLSNFETKNLQQLLRLSKIKEYEDGELIITEGESDPWIYILLSGKIRIEKDGVELGISDRIGEFFGEMRILDGLSRSASVYAKEKTVCMAVDTSAAVSRLSTDERANILFLLYRIFMEFLSMRLRLLSDELVKAKKEIENFTQNNSG